MFCCLLVYSCQQLMLNNVAQPESGVTILKKLLTTGNNVRGKTLFMSLSSRPIVKCKRQTA